MLSHAPISSLPISSFGSNIEITEGIKFINSFTGTTTGTVPTTAIDDLILIFAYRDGSSTPPTLGAGFTEIGSRF
jgi:hypothetical protein